MPQKARKRLSRKFRHICPLPGGQAALEIIPNQADVLIFYPGSMLAPGHYFVLLRQFWRAGFTVAALHLPGHGVCRRHFFQTFTFSQMLDQGLLAEKYLRKQGHKAIAVAGHSQGAILALAHAGVSPNLSATAAISGALPQMDEAIAITRFGAFQHWRTQIMTLLGVIADMAPWLPVPLPFYLSLHRILAGRRKPLEIGQDRGRIAYPMRYLHSLFAAQIASKMNCPTLLLGIKDDALFPPNLMRRVFNQITAPRKKLIFAPSGGHTAPYNEMIAQFLARHTAAFCASLGFPLNLRQ